MSTIWINQHNIKRAQLASLNYQQCLTPFRPHQHLGTSHASVFAIHTYIYTCIYIYVYNTHICMYIIMYLLIMRYHSAQEPHYAGTPCLPPCTAVLRREYSRSSCIVQRPGSFTLGKREVLHGTYNIYFKLLCFPQTWLGTTISSEGRGSSAIRLFGHRHFHRLASIFFLVKGIRTRLVLKNSVTSGQR